MPKETNQQNTQITFKNKVALVTGANTGIGRAIALELGLRGVTVIVHYYKDPASAKIVCSKIKSFGSQAYFVHANLTEEKDRVNLAKNILKITKKLDILVNNAGCYYDDDGLNISPENMQNYFALHTIAPLRLAVLLRTIMNNKSSIINIASRQSVVPRHDFLGYGASKAAMHSVTQSLAQGFAPIRVNTVSPGPVETDMWKDDDKKTKDSAAQKTILKRFAKPEEIAKVVAFLASQDASYITGANIIVDGGALVTYHS
jgi:3-oxoacyl-[acyl-carrier protein] reductase